MLNVLDFVKLPLMQYIKHKRVTKLHKMRSRLLFKYESFNIADNM